MTSLLDARRVSKWASDGRRRRQILAPVDLCLKVGQLTAITGASGAGKSTLLGILSACDPQYDGSVCLDGRELRSCSETQRARLRGSRCGYVWQGSPLIGHLSARQNVLLPAYFAGAPRAAVQRRADALLDQLGVGPLGEAPARHLSGGEQLRVGLARALLLQPALLFCDEPTGPLDEGTAERVVAALQGYCGAGNSVVVATHDAALCRLADQTVALVGARLSP